MNLSHFSLVFALICSFGFHEKGAASPPYLDQNPPGMAPVVFAPKLVSMPKEHEFGSVFARNASELFYGVDCGERSEIRSVVLGSNNQIKKQTIVAHERYSYNDPFLTPDGEQLFFISNQPLDRRGAKKDFDIWFVKRVADGWSAPMNAGSNVNSDHDEYYVSFTNEGSIFFSSNANAQSGQRHDFDIYSAARLNGVFQPPVRLSDAVNSNQYEADVFVAPDASYLIFCAKRKGGLGKGDLYVSFRQKAGSWTKAVNMGEDINTSGHELCPFVSLDQKYFFFTRDGDIYWVDAGIIEQLR